MKDTTPSALAGPLNLMGAFLLGLAFVLRLLTQPEPVSDPLGATLPTLLGLAGAGMMSAGAALGRRAFFGGLVAAAAILALAAGVRYGTDTSLLRGADLLAMLGLGFVVRAGIATSAFLRLGLCCAAWLGLVALAQSTHQHEFLQRALQGEVDSQLQSETARAFASSRRASGSVLNANVFAGLLLLLLPAAFAHARSWVQRSVASAIGIGFLCAASAGATVALLLALVMSKTPSPRLRRGAAALLASALVVGVLGVSGVSLGGLESKLQTLSMRGDYQLTALRLFPSVMPIGAGFGAYSDLSRDAVRDGSAWSAFAHQGWLEFLVETGLAGLPILLLFAWAVWRAARARPDSGALGSETSLSLAARGVLAGGICGAFLAPLFSLTMTPLPLQWGSSFAPLLPGLLAAVCFVLLSRVSLERLRPGWLSVGLLAFALHGFVDFDFSIPATGWMLAVVLGSVGATQRVTRGGVATTAALALLLLVAVPLTAKVLIVREASRASAQVPATSELAAWPRSTAASARALATVSPERASEIWLAWPEALRLRPRLREAMLAGLHRHLPSHPGAPRLAKERLAALSASGHDLSAQAAWLRYRLARMDGREEDARRAARSALDRAQVWPFDPAVRQELADWLGER